MLPKTFRYYSTCSHSFPMFDFGLMALTFLFLFSNCKMRTIKFAPVGNVTKKLAILFLKFPMNLWMPKKKKSLGQPDLRNFTSSDLRRSTMEPHGKVSGKY